MTAELSPASEAAEQAEVPVQINQIGSMFTVFFTATPVTDFQTAKTSDSPLRTLFHSMLEQVSIFLLAI
jgi:glutamate-1-semialdehyde 2,1-aminomutase